MKRTPSSRRAGSRRCTPKQSAPTPLDAHQKENLYSFVNKISVEFLAEWSRWPERAMKRLRLNNQYVLRSIEPTAGPISGGTLRGHGDHFVETGQCCVGSDTWALRRAREDTPERVQGGAGDQRAISLPDVEVGASYDQPFSRFSAGFAGRPSASSPGRYRALLCPPQSRMRTHSRASRHPC